MTKKEINELLQDFLKENEEDFSRIDFNPELLDRLSKLHVFAAPRERLIDEDKLNRFAEAAKFFRERTGYEVWFEVRVFFHVK